MMKNFLAAALAVVLVAVAFLASPDSAQGGVVARGTYSTVRAAAILTEFFAAKRKLGKG